MQKFKIFEIKDIRKYLANNIKYYIKMFKNKNNKKEEEKVAKKLLKKAQNWSLDLVLGIIVFLLILGVFYLLISKNSTTDIKGMKEQGNSILNHLDSSKSDSAFAFIDGNTINMTLLEELYKNPGRYQELKDELGISGDFCIVLEDKNGRVVVIDELSPGTGKIYGFGNSSLNVSGCLCGQPC